MITKRNYKLEAIGDALDNINIWDMSVEEIQDTIYKMFKNDKTKWIFENIKDNEDIKVEELDNLVVQYLEECTNYFEPDEEE